MSRGSKLVVALVIALTSLRSGAAEEKLAPAVLGVWKGTLRPGPVELRLVLKVRDEGGALMATLVSLDQGAKDIRVDTITRKAGAVYFAIAAIRGSYSGRISADGTRIEGIWSQGATSLPLVFERTETVETIRRPQEPKPPFPYEAEDVVFKNAAARVKLAGTLTLPASGKPFPAAVLVSGSGPQDRDETLMGHRPFFVLADHLTRLGIAVLRFDDRGVARSTGDFAAATTEDFATDALAGLEFLKRRPEIDPARVGLIGHSEGALIAPMVAARSKDVAFLVLIAAPSLRGEEILYLQAAAISRALGRSQEAITQERAIQEKIFAAIKESADAGKTTERIQAILADAAKAPGGAQATSEALGKAGKVLASPWFRFFLSYDPLPGLKQVKCPVLAVTGEKDLQVPPKENLPALEEALKQAGHPDYQALELPRLNHLLQTAETGAPSEYAKIEETMALSALSTISDWILKRTARPMAAAP